MRGFSFLWRGMMDTFLNPKGTSACLKDFMIMWNMGSVTTGARCFRTTTGIQSTPTALVLLRPMMIAATSVVKGCLNLNCSCYYCSFGASGSCGCCCAGGPPNPQHQSWPLSSLSF